MFAVAMEYGETQKRQFNYTRVKLKKYCSSCNEKEMCLKDNQICIDEETKNLPTEY